MQMNIPITHEKILPHLKTLLVGGNIDKVSYYITGWELRIVTEKQNDIIIFSSEVHIPEEELWLKGLSNDPFNLNMGNEPESIPSAILIFTVINSFSIQDMIIQPNGDFSLIFSNDRVVIFPGTVEGIDWAWQIGYENLNLVTCDTGELFCNNQLLEMKSTQPSH
jgi:hypothetical protein